MNKLLKTSLLSVFALIAAATPASAHLPPGAYGSVAAGFSHPFFGLDHILAMVAVGLWASQLGRTAMWAVPTTFMAAMAMGFGLALASVPLPMVEPMILASIVVLGALVALAVKLDIRFCAAVVALFALFHGHAHGGELGAAGALQFGLGFVLATGLLHGAGVAVGILVGRIAATAGTSGNLASRALGAVTAFAGIALAIV
ncbi:HupE/UreJ family protein [Hwanghaeella grinnelliae]|uniref:HupE/UreJ family protein n=1 Tax=Hwanghaeella grinnelliae TaxID=2500179 RepID=A0A437QGM2_9PROT|nr:HupE/UreJ family protein [Hwanghaeella grinnelliae]RVU33711.1 HupE/UreJ family protein [Hwanghaeella grinnelliae]